MARAHLLPTSSISGYLPAIETTRRAHIACVGSGNDGFAVSVHGSSCECSGQVQSWAVNQMLDSIPHIVWVAAPDGSTTYVNDFCVEYTGQPRDGELPVGMDPARTSR